MTAHVRTVGASPRRSRPMAHRAGERAVSVSEVLAVAGEVAALVLGFLVILYGLPVLAALAW